MSDKKVQVFHIGPPKTATTWIYHGLKEHPEIVTSPKDSIHYFDMFFHKGEVWYHDQFVDDDKEEGVWFDPTPAYSISALAPERIAQYNPDAKIILCLRHPVERAFSNYWHTKKKEEINVGFDSILRAYEYYSWWLEPGFYASMLERWLQYFPREQILVQFFDDIRKNPQSFMKEIYEFVGVDSNFVASSLHKKINTAGVKRTTVFRLVKSIVVFLHEHGFIPQRMYQKLKAETVQKAVASKQEYRRGSDPVLYREVLSAALPDIEKLEQLLDVNLDQWKQ